MRRISKAEWVRRIEQKHPGKFDFSLVPEGVGQKDLIPVKCKTHDVFEISWEHLQKYREPCPKCREDSGKSNERMGKERFIEKAEKIHGKKYDYSLTSFDSYKNHHSKVRITCPLHGPFEQTAIRHLSGSGCPHCARHGRRLTTEGFLKRASEVHGDTYDYAQVQVTTASAPIRIICRKHGVFEQKPSKHLAGQGCPSCRYDKIREKRAHTLEDFLRLSRDIHGDSYDYSEVGEYTNGDTPVKIHCPTHGVFLQRPEVHLRGGGCPTCAIEANAADARKPLSEFVKEAQVMHGNVYDYSEVEYKAARVPVRILCPTHGAFWRPARSHLRGAGCPRCETWKRSAEEVELEQFIASLLNPDIDIRIEEPVEYGTTKFYLDIAVPLFGLAFEFNGLYWHSDAVDRGNTRHSFRSNVADYNGYRLIHIFEDDWLHRRKAAEHLVRGAFRALPVIMARKTSLELVEHPEAREFYTNYHIQGYSIASGQIHMGLRLGTELVAVMSFSEYSSGRRKLEAGGWELVRFASKYLVQGGASKLFKHFVRTYQPSSVLSFSWNHLFTGKMYEVLGFKVDKHLPPDYSYVDLVQRRRLHKSGFQHSRLEARFGEKYDPTKSEQENCRANYFYRIYDCGKTRWLWTAP